jgi:hypothetical protein
MSLTFWCRGTTVIGVQCDAKKTKHQLKSLVKNMQSNGQPFKSQLFCSIHRVHNFGTKGLVREMWEIQELIVILSGGGC